MSAKSLAAARAAVLILATTAATHAFAAIDDSALSRSGIFARDRNTTVQERPRPGYQPVPYPVGGFVLLPSVTGNFEYNDNIYAATANRVSDGIVRVQPNLVLQSNWNSNYLQLFARANSSFYFKHTDENTTDWAVGGNSRLDASRDSGLSGGATYEHDTQPRSAAGAQALSRKPIRYYLGSGYVQGTQVVNDLRLTARGEVQDYNYQNGVAPPPSSAVVYQRDQNHTTWTGLGRAEFASSPTASIFAQGAINQRDYRDPLPNVPLRNSHGWEANVGTNFDITAVMRGEIYVGYAEQSFQSNAYPKIQGLTGRGLIQWFPTQLTTVTLLAQRAVQDATVAGSGGFLGTTASLTVDHELYRNILLNATAGYAEDKYLGVIRTDKRTNAGLGATYLLDRSLSVNVNYSYSHQNSDGPVSSRGPSYSINRVFAAVTYRP